MSDSVNGADLKIGAAVEQASQSQAFRAQLVVPEQRQLYDYWLEMAGDKAMPSRSNISPARLPRLLPAISLIDVKDTVENCCVRLAGTRLRELYDREITGLKVTDIPCASKKDYWLAAYRHTIEQATPTQGVVRGPMVHKEHVVQYWLKLPLRTDGDKVGMLLCYDHFMLASEILQDEDQKIRAVS
jgi:hypothetical protein